MWRAGRPIHHFGVDWFDWPSARYFFLFWYSSPITLVPICFLGFFEYGGSAGVRLSKIICESNFRRHPWNYELSDELFSWIDFPFVLSAENEYEGASLNGGIIPWHLIYLTAPIWTSCNLDPLQTVIFHEAFRLHCMDHTRI